MHNHRRREEQRKEQAKLEKTARGVNHYYGIGAVIALGVMGGLGYYIFQTKKGEQPCTATPGPQGPSNPKQNNPKPHPQAVAVQPQSNKFEMD